MNATIDTLATYEAIAAAGIDDRGARAISKAIADAAATYREDIATKADLDRVEAKLDAKLDSGIGELRELIASTQNKTLIWIFGMLVTCSGIVVGIVKLT